MNTKKRISWHAAAIAAALMFSGVASADHHGNHGNYRDHGRGSYRGDSHRDGHGGDYRRVWRENGRHDYRFYDHGYAHERYRSHRYYYPSDRYYGNGNYYGTAWPDYGFGATLTFGIPLR